jgi:hypothetical protein
LYTHILVVLFYIPYPSTYSPEIKLGWLENARTKWRFIAGKSSINGDYPLPCLIPGGYFDNMGI